jgi:hypothetical protein
VKAMGVQLMESAAAYGVYGDEGDVAEIVRTLNSAGFKKEHICLMFAPTHPMAEMVRSASVLNVNAGREDGAATAGVIGWLSELGAVVIPTVGFFIRSRVFFNVLVAAGEPPSRCGNSRMLVGLGFPDLDAERFEEKLRHTGFLVYVASPEIARVRWAVELLRGTGANETATLEKRASAGAVA